jgi:hypothetical protein
MSDPDAARERHDAVEAAREANALRRVWAAIVEHLDPDQHEIATKIIWDAAVDAGLAERVPYDSKRYGVDIEAEPGDLVPVLTPLGTKLRRPPASHLVPLARGETGSTVRCDMRRGPCACGAWHDEREAVRDDRRPRCAQTLATINLPTEPGVDYLRALWLAHVIRDHGQEADALPDGSVRATCAVLLPDNTWTKETVILRSAREVRDWLGY